MIASLLTVKELSQWLTVKPSTLYAWAAQGKIPCVHLHGLVRFDPQAVQRWLQGCMRQQGVPSLSVNRVRRHRADADLLIARAKQDVYTSRHGETRAATSPEGKEGTHGAR